MVHAQTTTKVEEKSTENLTYIQHAGTTPRLTWTIPAAAMASGLSTRMIWYAIAKKKLDSVQVGKRRLIPDRSLRQFLGV